MKVTNHFSKVQNVSKLNLWLLPFSDIEGFMVAGLHIWISRIKMPSRRHLISMAPNLEDTP